MNNIESFTTLKLEFSRVAWYLGNLLSALLGRQITCGANAEDDSYWSISAENDRFSNTEVVALIQYVGGDATMIRRCIPPDANSSRSLDMDLCRALLKHVLKLDWEQEFVTKDALWILGHWPEPMKLPEMDENLIFIDSKIIDFRKLMSKDEFVDKLFDEGGTFTALTDLCEEYELDFGTPLYWMHPYTDGLYTAATLFWFRKVSWHCPMMLLTGRITSGLNGSLHGFAATKRCTTSPMSSSSGPQK